VCLSKWPAPASPTTCSQRASAPQRVCSARCCYRARGTQRIPVPPSPLPFAIAPVRIGIGVAGASTAVIGHPVVIAGGGAGWVSRRALRAPRAPNAQRAQSPLHQCRELGRGAEHGLDAARGRGGDPHCAIVEHEALEPEASQRLGGDAHKKRCSSDTGGFNRSG